MERRYDLNGSCHNNPKAAIHQRTAYTRNFSFHCIQIHFGFRIRQLRCHHFRLDFWYAFYVTILFRGVADSREQVLQYT